jgi:hypothetical protein
LGLRVTFPLKTDGGVGWGCLGAADNIVQGAFEILAETSLNLAFSSLNICRSFDHVLVYEDIFGGDLTLRAEEIAVDICDVKLIEYNFSNVKHSLTEPFIVFINFHDCYGPRHFPTYGFGCDIASTNDQLTCTVVLCKPCEVDCGFDFVTLNSDYLVLTERCCLIVTY